MIINSNAAAPISKTIQSLEEVTKSGTGSLMSDGNGGVELRSYPMITDGPFGVATFGDSTATIFTGSAFGYLSNIPFIIPTSGTTAILPDSTSRLVGGVNMGFGRYVGDFGIGGQTTTQMLARGSAAYSTTRKAIQDLAKLSGVKLIIVRGGTINDCIGFTTSTNDETINAVADRHVNIIRKILSMGFFVIDCGIYGYDNGGISVANLAAIRRAIVMVNARISTSLMAELRYKFICPEGVLSNSGAFIAGLSDDGIHLNVAGSGALEAIETPAVNAFVQGTSKSIAFSDYDKLFMTPSSGLPSTVTIFNHGGASSTPTTTDGILSLTGLTGAMGSGYRVNMPILPQIAGKLSGDKFYYTIKAECRNSSGDLIPCVFGYRILMYDITNAALSYYLTTELINGGEVNGISQTFSLDRAAGLIGSNSYITIEAYPQIASGSVVIKVFPPSMYSE